MGKLRSLSIFVGQGLCNARCNHCAGVPLRKYAPVEDGTIDEVLIYETLKDCYRQGARSLSISSSGEPTLSPISVTKALHLARECENEGISFDPINLYSNGIRIGEDEQFCQKYLSLWSVYGLKQVYVTVHDINESKNAAVYGIKSYPSLKKILSRIHSSGLLMRANLVLNRKTIGTLDEFTSSIGHLLHIGVDRVSAWPVRTLDDKVDTELSPPADELEQMEIWVRRNFDSKKVRLLLEKSKVAYKSGKKLTLFPDGTLSSSWCN